jgi:FkbM family methyltransferase
MMQMARLKRAVNPWTVTRFSLGFPRAEAISISFNSGGLGFHALVPPSTFWTAVKDVLIHEAYKASNGFRLSELPKDAIVVDAGSFVGLYALKASAFVGKVISIEPNFRNYSILRSNLESNLVDNVEARNVALWSTSGRVNFVNAETISRVMEKGSAEATSITLEELVDELGHIDLLKMDIEGAEYDVLLGTDCGTLGRIAKIVLEVHDETPAERQKRPLLLKHLKDCWTKVEVLTPKNRFLKPWRCSLSSRALGFRLWLTLAYMLEEVQPVRQRFDTGRTFMVYASR